MMMGNRAAADVSMRYGFRGPCEATVTACAAGTHSVANGARLVATGRCDVVVAGSAEAAMTQTGTAGFTNMTALSSSGISMPFDNKRDGFVIGEGGAILILEELRRAQARGAHIYAEIMGGASTADAYHITAPSPHGSGAVACMELALIDAGITAASSPTSTPTGLRPPPTTYRNPRPSSKCSACPALRHLDQRDHGTLAGRQPVPSER